MGQPYRLFTQASVGYNASIFYRTFLPFNMFEKLGFPVDPIVDFGEADVPVNIRSAMVLESDITLAYQTFSQFRYEIMRQCKTLVPMKDHDGIVRWPATFVVDTDDDLFNVQPLNMTFGRFGIKDPTTGETLKDGDEIGIAHPLEVAPPETEAKLNKRYPSPITGARGSIGRKRFIFSSDGHWHAYFQLWQDGRNIDIAKNRDALENWRRIMSVAQLITCSTPRVEQYVKRELGPDAPTFVTPNAIDFDIYPDVELRDHPDEVRILWQGSATHHEDVWPLNDAIKRVAEKYPQTTWWFWGGPYKWAVENIPKGRGKLIPWVHQEAYVTRLTTMNHDINLAPLNPHIFNLSRSAIKWYESSAICKPAVTLAQKTGAYEDEIQDNETGLLFGTPEEFELKLGGLIEDEMLRKRLASNAKDWVRTYRDARQVMTRLFGKYVEVREGHKQTMPKPDEMTESASLALTSTQNQHA